VIQSIRRNLVLVIGLLLAGLVMTTAAPALRSITGESGPTVGASVAPVGAVLRLVVAFALATVVAALVGRLVNALVGLFCLGGAVFALNTRLGNFQDAAFHGTVGGAWIESILWAGLTAAAALVVFQFAGPLPDVEPTEDGRRPDPIRIREAVLSAATGVLVLPAIWLLSLSDMKGQVVGAVIVGGLAVGLAGRLLSPHVQPVLIFATPVLFGGLGQLVASMVTGGPVDVALVEQDVPRLLLPLPIDLVAGSLIGVSLGLGWAPAFLEHDETTPAAAGAEVARPASADPGVDDAEQQERALLEAMRERLRAVEAWAEAGGGEQATVWAVGVHADRTEVLEHRPLDDHEGLDAEVVRLTADADRALERDEVLLSGVVSVRPDGETISLVVVELRHRSGRTLVARADLRAGGDDAATVGEPKTIIR